MKLYIVVPFYNEEKLLPSLLDALNGQTDCDFHVIFVDNNSSDSSVKKLHDTRVSFSWEVIEEKEKGTGSACDTGFRYAITKLGAQYIARTDADCLPRKDWVQNIKKHFLEEQLDFMAGVIQMRTDDTPPFFLDAVVIPLFIKVAGLYGRLMFGRKGFKYDFFLVAGNNLAITAAMYIKAGGFPRSAIDHTDEDLVLCESVRRLTDKSRLCKDLLVYNSARRLRKYGYWNTMMWYKQRAYSPTIVDIR